MTKRASPMPRLKKTLTKVFWSAWQGSQYLWEVYKQWTSCQRKISTSSHHLDYDDDSDIIDDLYLIPADHNLHILLHLNVSSLLVVNVLPVVLVANSEELHLEDPDDGGTERHRASADANWI